MSSRNGLRLLGAIALLGLPMAEPAAAQSSSYCDSIEQMLETAGMTYTRTGTDGHCADVETPGGTRRIYKPEDVMDLIKEGPDPIQPADGNWRRDTEVDKVDCPGAEALYPAIVAQIQQMDRVLSTLMGSTDGGDTVPYRFRSTFNASLLLGPMISALNRAHIGTTPVQYTRLGQNVFQAVGEITQPSTFNIGYEVELGVISQHLIMGHWYGEAEGCSAQGTFYWTWEGP